MSRKENKQISVEKEITSQIWKKQATRPKPLKQIYMYTSEEGLGQTDISSKFHNSSFTLIKNSKHQTQRN